MKKQELEILTQLLAALRHVNKKLDLKIELRQKNTSLNNLRLVENGKTLVKGDIQDIDKYVAGMIILADAK